MSQNGRAKAPARGNRNIKDFFTPYVKTPPHKRPREDGLREEDIAYEPRRSKSPRTDRDSSPSVGPPHVHRRSHLSGTSSLSSIASDTPSELSPSPSPPPQQQLAQSFDGSFDSNSSTMPSSQRRSKNGQEMIIDSDEEDTDGSLQDLDDIINAKGFSNISKPASKEPELTQIRRTRSGKNLRNFVSTIPERKPVKPSVKYSLDALLARNEKENMATAMAESAIALADDLEKERIRLEELAAEGKLGENLNLGGFASRNGLSNGSGELEKLHQALNRLDALQFTKSWGFFAEERIPSEKRPFPSVRNESLGILLNDPTSREINVLSGYVADLSRKNQLPDAVLSWFLDMSIAEPKDCLRMAYANIIGNAERQIKSLITKGKIEQFFRELGASGEAVNLGMNIQPTERRTHDYEATEGFWQRVQCVLQLVSSNAKWIDRENRMHILCVFSGLAVDFSIGTDRACSAALEDAIAALITPTSKLTSHDECNEAFEIIRGRILDHRLCLQLLQTIPSTTSQLRLVRRRLAMSIFHDNSTYLSLPSNSLCNLPQITSLLKTRPEFRIWQKTDYATLAATMSILDIGINNANPPSNLEEQKQFNKEIDRLSRAVKDMFTRIVDAGTAHMKRTEAKDVMESLHARLEFAVRTTPKPKRDIFGDIRHEEGEVGIMKWVRPEKKTEVGT